MNIVAIVIENRDGDRSIIRTKCQLCDIDFQDEVLRIGQFYLVYDWFEQVSVCNQEMLDEYLKNLKKA